MERRDFLRLEDMCQLRFVEAQTLFHVCSKENHPVLFHNEDEFKVAMNIVAFVAFSLPDIRILTFEIMHNHFHFAIEGNRESVQVFVKTLLSRLSFHPDLKTSQNDIKLLDFKIFNIGNLDNLRNVISYINRNGSVVSPNENVFTYKWGANRFFFNTEAKSRFKDSGRKSTCREKRKMFCSALLDKMEKVILVDGYVSPLCFCAIDRAESFFRNSRHYFHSVSRNIESSKDIAKDIGENLFYTDDDLYGHIRMICSKRHGGQSINAISFKDKMEIAKELHFDFNAGNKQICRLLKMDIQTVTALFPKAF
ncbi:MAG: hypothetical protein MJY61_04995 [Bacteroidales bacterium]|nr:hypothetical protein [Bacteroidales bacterium]